MDKDIPYKAKHDWAVVLRYGKIVFNNGNPNGSGDQPLLANSPVNDGAWHHVAIARDAVSGRTTIHIDGNKDAEGYFATDDLTNPLPLYVGAEDGIEDRFKRAYRGELDELRLWNLFRSQKAIQSSMFLKLSGDETGLVGYWPFDEGTGQVAHDATSYHNDGRLGDSPEPDSNDPAWVICDGMSPPLPPALHLSSNQ